MTDDLRTSAHLRFSTEIVRRLGEELNPTLDKGVLELVKNAYDADATECRIELRGTDQPGGKIIVRDNGDGMTADQIANGWLVLGRSSKASSQQTRLGRIPAGSKGLGRLAALRMGRTALLSTSSRDDRNRRHEILIDWEEFDKAAIVEDVALEIRTRGSNKRFPPGTKVVIDDLHTGFGRVPVKRLAREILLLADPFTDDPKGFQPELLVPEYEDLESLVRNRYFDDAEYHLMAEVGSSGQASAQVFDWKGECLYSAEHKEIAPRNRNGTYDCPPVKFELWAFILNKDTFSLRQSSIGEVRDWLSEFGGVHFYYNGLRVSPYGGPDDDWIGMNLRRVRSPEERPSTNTSIGRIDVFDQQSQLVEKTDRSGFIEDGPFRELRAFARDSMDWMASRRLREAEQRRRHARAQAPKRSGKAKEHMESTIAATPKKTREDLEKAFESYESFRDREVDSLKKEVQLYRTLSTAGITAATFAHESNANPVKIISSSLGAIHRRAKKHFGELYDNNFKRPIDGIRGALASLSVLSRATLDLLDHEKRRTARIDLHEVLDDVLLTYAPFFKGRDVEVIKSFASGTPFLRGQRASVESIITNLLTNSLAAFEDAATRDRVVEISTQLADDQWSLSVSDSGPGIVGIRKSDIWLPGHTTRNRGTGLGLTIVRDAVQDLGGSVEALESGPRGGAVITVHLPIIGT
ncbi:MAG: ATP-binding protein [Gammaproteobacteria bacterium]|nr:ATP-binding protein [Gammaproteobacteria bacterium]MDE0246378.1 ATP-binding protein [Gammaproteobacteria bacterium]